MIRWLPTCGSTCVIMLGRWWRGSIELQTALMEQAARHLDLDPPTAVAGLTHTQHAQPVLLSHQLLAHVQAFCAGCGAVAGLGQAGGGIAAWVGGAGRVVAGA